MRCRGTGGRRCESRRPPRRARRSNCEFRDGCAINRRREGCITYADSVDDRVAIGVNGARPSTLGSTTMATCRSIAAGRTGDVVEVDFRWTHAASLPTTACAPRAPGRRRARTDRLLRGVRRMWAAGARSCHRFARRTGERARRRFFGGATLIRDTSASLANPAAARPISLIPYPLWANRGWRR